MAHFNNINSLADLKEQYRTLVLANHPDKGGDTAVMQEINAEYDRLYAIWIVATPVETRPTASAEESRRHFYTQNGWCGSRYNSNMGTKDIAAAVREYCKENWSQWKFSVRCHFASMCASIDITLKGGPIKAGLVANEDGYERKYGAQTCYHYHDHDERVVPEAEVVMKDVVNYCMSFNYDDSDGMIDYFDTNFYLHETVAGQDEWVVTKVKARIAEPKTDKIEKKALGSGNIQIINYSDKCVAVIGETKPIKDQLKSMGGRFNPRLTVGEEQVSGWVFNSAKNTVESLAAALM